MNSSVASVIVCIAVAFRLIVLPFEGDALRIACDQASIRDGNPVGIARQIAQHLFGPGERALAIQFCAVG